MTQGIVQPALIIGTGGSGIEVVRRFKRRFDEVYPNTPYVQVLGIDTAPQEELGHEVPQLDESDFLYAAGFNMDFWVGRDAIDNHPEIRHWWRGYDRLPLKTVKSGAGQKRPVGRLALFVNYDDVVQRIRAHVTELFRSEVFVNLPGEYRRAVNLYIISSTCGGTGTGQFLDLAYIANETIKGVRPGINVNPRGLFFLPSAFLDTNQVPPQNAHRLRANAYGALTELDHLMNPEVVASDVTFPGNRNVSRSDAPFRSVYLVGNQTTAGKLITDFHEIMERAAVHVMIELASPVKATGDARMDNVLSAIAAKGTVKGRGRSYSSFGEEWLELPTARLRVRWQKRLALQIIDRLMPPEAEQLASKGAELDDSGSYGKLKALWTAAGLNRFIPSVEAERAIFTDIGQEGLDPSEIQANANALEAAATTQLNAVESQIAEDFAGAAAEVPEELRRNLIRILRDGNLREALALLSRTEETIRNWITRGHQEGGRQRAGAWTEALGARLAEARPGLIQSKKKYADAQRQIVLEGSHNAREEWLDRLKAQVGGAADRELPAVQVEIRELRERLERASNYLMAARALLEKQSEPRPATGTGVTLSDGEIDEAYEAGDRLQRLEREAAQQLKNLLDVHPVTVEALAQTIWGSAGHAVRQLAGEFLQNVSIPVEEIASRLKELQPLAVFEPSWDANPAKKDVQCLRIIGLPEASMSRKEDILRLLPVGIRTATEAVSHADADRVVMTVQDHGFPLFALNETGDLRKAFEALDPSEKVMCFVDRDENARKWDFLPESPREAKQYFSLGFVLGLIRQVGPRLVFNAGGPTDTDVPFSEGRDRTSRYQNALDDFLAGGYATDVRRRLAAEEQRDTPALYAKCLDWVATERRKQQGGDYPEFFTEVVDFVEEYARSIEA